VKKNIIIILGEPNSISSEIFLKSLNHLKKLKLNYIIIGSFSLLKKQAKFLGYKKKLNFFNNEYNKIKYNKFSFVDIAYNQRRSFDLKTNKSRDYLNKCFLLALKLLKIKVGIGLINFPINKSKFTQNKFRGITEYIATKTNNKGKENMLLFNEEFSVLPLTTHISLEKVSKFISYKKIEQACRNVTAFYKKTLKRKKVKIGILGLNPHNGEDGFIGDEERKIIIPAINKLKKRYPVYGPLSPDTSFLQRKKMKIDVLIGHYHDQVLTTFKNIFDFNAINITIGLPFIRISPDHGTGSKIIGKNIASAESFIKAINFFSKYNVQT
jgi:4-hydroxythreonine-4-phosphate dehydrogenase